MNIEKLRTLLERHEGRRKTPYRCTANKLTIGIGHNIESKGLPMHTKSFLDSHGFITDTMIDELFKMDIEDTLEDCHKLYPDFDSFSENRQIALADFVFNVGLTTAKTFKNTNKAINDERWKDAADNLEESMWYAQVGVRSKEIVKLIREG